MRYLVSDVHCEASAVSHEPWNNDRAIRNGCHWDVILVISEDIKEIALGTKEWAEEKQLFSSN